MAAVEDQQPVETFGADGADEPLSDRVRLGCLTGLFTIRMPSLRKTLSKEPLYLLSRSPIRKRAPWSAKSRPRFRACWVTDSPLGFFVQPANQIRRLA
jgi:hypothetical protein